MIATIEARSVHRYGARMRSIMLHLLALIAVMLLPFGMAAAPAEAHQMQMPSATATEHCPDDSSETGSWVLAECAMPCSAALPAVDAPTGIRVLLPAPEKAIFVLGLPGIELEIATPPPKLT